MNPSDRETPVANVRSQSLKAEVMNTATPTVAPPFGKVSIILPTYNRAAFLPEAITAIRNQQYQNWELIVVDDGSTDDTASLLPTLVDGLQQPYRYIHQPNAGAYAARNTGLDQVTGEYVAFYDSDDLWLPHHLSKCVTALKEHADVDWVYAASRIIDHATGAIINENCFQDKGKPKAFQTLPAETRGQIRVLLPDRLFEEVLSGVGLYAGLQNSLIRSHFFNNHRFITDFHDESEDRVMVLRAIASGVHFAYFPDVHVEYYVHGENSSGAATDMPREKRLRLALGMIQGLEDLENQIALSRYSKRLLRTKLADLYMWQLGYHAHWLHGYRTEAITAYKKALRLNVWELKYWKTLLLATFRARQ